MPTEPPPLLPSIAKNGLQILHEILRLGSYSCTSPGLSDAVLITIDFENINTIKSGFSQKANCQAGLALLDTKELSQKSPNKLISTYNLATGCPSYLKKASEKFIFGGTINIGLPDMADRIQSLIPPARNVVFVDHGILNDFQALQALNFQFPVRLESVLDNFQVVLFNRFHCAGNDANLTLRALLLLAAEGFPGQELGEVEKRKARSRKYQAKSWGKEKQEETRAARRLKKENVMKTGPRPGTHESKPVLGSTYSSHLLREPQAKNSDP
ncbi:hypothetical protein BDV96DRAFT_649606 [Lophiotrema nucula]|uniref:Exonuclease domain-containing protein n=1 Tax=Lophiotrema nucula TaxID=690887 RepID=A0A6A5YXT4_9PLEO|nr:hypothetical protein BDV96DRAFT_649606 [Lophiotrema nucula]